MDLHDYVKYLQIQVNALLSPNIVINSR